MRSWDRSGQAWTTVDSGTHRALGGATPLEVYFGSERACEKARFEPRARYPARDNEKIRARRGAKVRLEVSYLDGEKLLPIVAVKAA